MSIPPNPQGNVPSAEEKYNIEAFKTQVDADANQFSQINTSYKIFLQNDKLLNGSRMKLSNDFNSMSISEKAPKFKEVLKNISDGLKHISEHQQTYITKIEKNILSYPALHHNTVKDLRAQITNYQKLQTIRDKAQIAFAKDPTKKKALDEAESNLVAERVSKLNSKVKDYEHERMVQLKYMLVHLINAEMFYHAKSLEILSELMGQANNIDPQKENDEILRSMIEK